MKNKEEDLKKSMYKAVLRNIRSKNKKKAQAVVADILDPNYIAEVDKDMISPSKTAVLDKSEKGLVKLKRFIENRKSK